MRDAEEENRRAVLRQLIADKSKGNVARFCNLYPELNPVYIAALVRDGSDKPFGAKAARTLEKKMGLPRLALESMEGIDSMARIEIAINSADFLSDSEKRNFLGLLKGMKAKKS